MSLVPNTIHVYTDGSYDQITLSSSWSIVVGDKWLNQNYDSVPSKESVSHII
jgi:hypothetical protein